MPGISRWSANNIGEPSLCSAVCPYVKTFFSKKKLKKRAMPYVKTSHLQKKKKNEPSLC